ncbi:MAG TPA: hypothetical protein ENN03_06545 [bacterium]|nr:hypothetical protein [bacterium]
MNRKFIILSTMTQLAGWIPSAALSAPADTKQPVTFSGYVQTQYNAPGGDIHGFRLRRARLSWSGRFNERLQYRLQGDWSGSSARLLDAELIFVLAPLWTVSAGQFKIPFSAENLLSSAALETINRSSVVEALAARGRDILGNQNGRDTGIRLSGGMLPTARGPLMEFFLGLFNGSGINATDRDDHKDVAFRILLHPAGGIILGGSLYRGRMTEAGDALEKRIRNREGIELTITSERLSLRSEYISGRDGDIRRGGWYVQAALAAGRMLQCILKYDTLNPDTDLEKDEESALTLGINWLMGGKCRLQTHYAIHREHGSSTCHNQWAVQWQIGY